MTSQALIEKVRSLDKEAIHALFDAHYATLGGIARRFAKSDEQAEQLTAQAFQKVIEAIQQNRETQIENADAFIRTAFIDAAIAFIKAIRSEYFVSSTVNAAQAPKPAEAAEGNASDFSNVDPDTLLHAIRQLVPAQRLVFNLHVVEGYSLEQTAEKLDASKETVKSNLEKSRFNLQKHIEKTLKTAKP